MKPNIIKTEFHDGSPARQKHPGGRPTLYRPEIGARIADEMASGLSLEAAAAECGVGPRTAFTWQDKHDEFRQFIEEGRARSLLFWERRAIALANGAPGNANVVTLGLKNRSRNASGWFDAQRLEHSGPDGGPIRQELTSVLDVSGLDVEELLVLEKALMATVGAGT